LTVNWLRQLWQRMTLAALTELYLWIFFLHFHLSSFIFFYIHCYHLFFVFQSERFLIHIGSILISISFHHCFYIHFS
jgi:hypothetical protein